MLYYSAIQYIFMTTKHYSFVHYQLDHFFLGQIHSIYSISNPSFTPSSFIWLTSDHSHYSTWFLYCWLVHILSLIHCFIYHVSLLSSYISYFSFLLISQKLDIRTVLHDGRALGLCSRIPAILGVRILRIFTFTHTHIHTHTHTHTHTLTHTHTHTHIYTHTSSSYCHVLQDIQCFMPLVTFCLHLSIIPLVHLCITVAESYGLFCSMSLHTKVAAIIFSYGVKLHLYYLTATHCHFACLILTLL